MRNAGFIKIQSCNGEFHATIRPEINEQLDNYCKAIGMNKSAYINLCVQKCLAEDKAKFVRDQYQVYTKDQLIEMIIENRKEIKDGWTALQE